MKTTTLLFAFFALIWSSCSTAYKIGQTPDDVYYSPTRVIEEDINIEKDEVNNTQPEDRKIRMAAHDRRWRHMDDDCSCNGSSTYDPYHYGYNYGYYYNPYYYPYPVYSHNTTIVNPKNNTPRMTNLGSYNNTVTTSVEPKTGVKTRVNTRGVYNNTNNGGGFIRRVFTPSDNSAPSNNSNNNTRTYTPSTNTTTSTNTAPAGTVSRPSRNQ